MLWYGSVVVIIFVCLLGTMTSVQKLFASFQDKKGEREPKGMDGQNDFVCVYYPCNLSEKFLLNCFHQFVVALTISKIWGDQKYVLFKFCLFDFNGFFL